MTSIRPDPADRAPPKHDRHVHGALIGLLAVAVLFALGFAAEVAIPIVAALILYLLLSPVARTLIGVGVPRELSALLIVAVAISSIGYGTYALGDPAAQWFSRTPTLGDEVLSRLQTILEPVERVQKAAEKVKRAAEDAGKKMDGGARQPEESDDAARAAERRAIEVTVREPSLSERILGFVRGFGLSFGVSFVVVVILVIFLLAYGEEFKARLVKSLRTAGAGEKLEEVLEEVERDVSVYLGTITVINIVLGAVIAVALHLLGFPNAALWGAIAAFSNFVPYFGPVVSVGVTAVVGLISAPSIELALAGVLVHFGLNFLEGQLLTPMIVGRRLTVSPIIVFLSVVFWGWLWGVAGALMAVPILLVLRVVSAPLETLRPLSLLLGGNGESDHPPPPDPARPAAPPPDADAPGGRAQIAVTATTGSRSRTVPRG